MTESSDHPGTARQSPERGGGSSSADLQDLARSLAAASLRDGLDAERADAARQGAAGGERVRSSRRSVGALVVASVLLVVGSFWGGGVLLGGRGEAWAMAGSAVGAVEDLARTGHWSEVPAAVEVARTAVGRVGASELGATWSARLDQLDAEALAHEGATKREAARAAWRLDLERAIPPMPFGAGHGVVDWSAVDRELTALFARVGIGVAAPEGGSGVEVVADDPLRFHLEAWGRVRHAAGDLPGANEVLRLAMRIDPHPLRDSLRAARFSGDDEALVRIAAGLDRRSLDVATLVCAARALQVRSLMDRTLVAHITPQLFLEELCERHPDEPYAALELGRAFRAAQPWRALRYYHAAHALRPGSLALRREYLTLIAGGRLFPPYVAERETRLALDLFPSDPWLLRLLGRRELEIGVRNGLEDVVFFGDELWAPDFADSGLAKVRTLVESGPRPDRLALEATALGALGRHDEARAAAERGLELAAAADCPAPVQARLWQELGIARARSDNGDDVESALRRAVELAPDDPRGVWLLADHLAADHPDEAEALLTSALERLPPHRLLGVLRKRLAEVLLQLGELDRALELAEQLVTATPRDPAAQQVLGKVRQGRGERTEARDCFRKALEVLPLASGRLSGLAVAVLEELVEVVVELEGSEAGVALLQQEIARSVAEAPDGGLRRPMPDPVLLFLLGRLHRQAGELQSAIDAWRAAVEAGLDTPEVLGGIAELYEERRELLTGLRWRERAAERWPGDLAVARGYAMALLEVGRPAEAAAEAERCRALGPDKVWPRVLLIDALVATREFAAAAERVAGLLAAQRSGELRPGETDPPLRGWDYTNGLGDRMLNVEQEHAVAERLLGLALELDANVPETWCNYAAAIWRQGRPAEALPHMRHGHELGSRRVDWPYPSARWIAEIERELAAGEGDAAPLQPATGEGR